MSFASRASTVAILSLTLLGTRTAHANGAFPYVNQLVHNPADPDQLVLRGSFGLTVSRDGGVSWDWLCESGMGYQDVLPPVAVLPSGVVLLALPTGISRGDPSWCDFQPADGIQAQVIDLSAVRAAPGAAIAASRDVGAGTSQVWESVDDGATWLPLGAPIENFHATTLDAAATDPDIIYVSGISVGTNSDDFLLRSPDHGQSWDQFLVPSSSVVSSVPYIGAVAPNDGDTLYIRRDGSPGSVLVTRDGGMTFDTILEVGGPVSALALSPDGSTLLASNPRDGVYRIDTASLEVEHLACNGVSCLNWNDGGLFACGDIYGNHFLVGSSADEGVNFDILLSPSCVNGPLACDVSTSTGAVCPDQWSTVKMGLDAPFGTTTCTIGTLPPRVDVCLGGGAGGEGGSGATAGNEAAAGGMTAGSGGVAGSEASAGQTFDHAGAPSGGAAAMVSKQQSEPGCGCVVGEHREPPLWALLWGAAAAWLPTRRRRAHSGRPSSIHCQ